MEKTESQKVEGKKADSQTAEEKRLQTMKEKWLQTMKNWLETMDFYIEAGRSLNYTNPNNNFDLKEIARFFSPIDRLFGDYEVRQRQGIENFLYRRNTAGEPVEINRKTIRTQATNGFLLLLIICQDQKNRDLRVNYGWIKINKPEADGQSTIEYGDNAEEALKVDPNTVKHIYVLEPTKLNRAIDLDEGYYNSYQNGLLEVVIDGFNEIGEHERAVLYGQIDRYVDSLHNREELTRVDGDNQQVHEAFSAPTEDIKPLVKLKNYRRYENVKLRLGQYKDGRYVIYLHPYWSESNCPVRIPSE